MNTSRPPTGPYLLQLWYTTGLLRKSMSGKVSHGGMIVRHGNSIIRKLLFSTPASSRLCESNFTNLTVSSVDNVLGPAGNVRTSERTSYRTNNINNATGESRVCASPGRPLSESLHPSTRQAPDSFRPSDYVAACSFRTQITWLLYLGLSTAIYFAYKLFLRYIAYSEKRKFLIYLVDISRIF